MFPRILKIAHDVFYSESPVLPKIDNSSKHIWWEAGLKMSASKGKHENVNVNVNGFWINTYFVSKPFLCTTRHGRHIFLLLGCWKQTKWKLQITNFRTEVLPINMHGFFMIYVLCYHKRILILLALQGNSDKQGAL